MTNFSEEAFEVSGICGLVCVHVCEVSGDPRMESGDAML